MMLIATVLDQRNHLDDLVNQAARASSAAPLSACGAFWEKGSFGGGEYLATTKNTKPHKESAWPAPIVV